MYIDIIATQKLSVNEKNLDLCSEMILKACNEDMKFVCELCCRIYVDIKVIQKSSVKESSNLCFKMSIRFVMKI